MVKNDDGSHSRGYKLATLRTLLDTAGLLTQVAMGPIQQHDLELCRELLWTSAALRRGDLVIEDRGFLDGQTLGHLKGERGVDVIIPLKSNMHAYSEAVSLAEMERQWEPHPSRRDQQIAFVRGVDHVWDERQVALNACVIRFYNRRKRATDYIVLVTTDLKLSAQWMVRHYEERPEIEQDYQQLKSGGWHLQKLSSTRYTENRLVCADGGVEL
ncbi:MAG: transposase [Pyrinomonadaceae bacterium]